MKAVILAAGRPGPTFPDNSKQKTLYRIGGEVLLERIVNQLKEAGFEHIRIVTGYGAEGIEKFNRDRKLGLELVYNLQWDGDPVESGRCGIKDLDEDILFVFSDILTSTEIFKKFRECKAPLAWIKQRFPWAEGFPDDEVFKADRNVSIVKIAKEKLTMFEEEAAEKYIAQITERCHPHMTYKGRLCNLLLEGMYRNGPVEEIEVQAIPDVDYYDRTDEGHLVSLVSKSARTNEGDPGVRFFLFAGKVIIAGATYSIEV